MSFGSALFIVTVSGFISLSYEILWFRAYSFASASGPKTFGLLLFVYLVGLALGSFGAKIACVGKDADANAQAHRLRWMLAAVVVLSTLLGWFLLPLMARLVVHIDWRWTLLLVAVVASSFGVILPLVSHLTVSPDGRAGAGLSYLYVGNIVGACLGSIMTGFILLDILPLPGVALLQLLAGLLLSTAVITQAIRARRSQLLAMLALAVVAAVAPRVSPALFDQFYERLLSKEGFNTAMRFLDVVENRHGVIAVAPADDGTRMVFGDGVYDGNITWDLLNDRNGIYRVFSLVGFHPKPRRVLVVGLSTGAWTQILAHMPGVREITAIEINPGYLPLINKYPEVSSLLRNPKLKIIIDDGRRWIRRHPNLRFDLIVQNTTVHWRAHSSVLLSKKYFELCARRLAHGGILLVNTTYSRHVDKTALAVFRDVRKVGQCIVASNQPLHFDASRWASVLRTFQVDGKPLFDLRRDGDRRRFQGLTSAEWYRRRVRERDDLRRLAKDATVITDDNMYCEWHTMKMRHRK